MLVHFANSDQVVASQIDRWSCLLVFANQIESESFASVVAAEQVAARLIASVQKVEIDPGSASQIDQSLVTVMLTSCRFRRYRSDR